LKYNPSELRTANKRAQQGGDDENQWEGVGGKSMKDWRVKKD